MSEKNGHSGAQWTKAAAQKQHLQGSTHLYEHTTATLPPPTALYGGGGAALSYARFQPPPIHHASAPPQSPHAPATVLTPLGSSAIASNVPGPPMYAQQAKQHISAENSKLMSPGPSGFVPPPFPPTAAATSVLTPNPFAVTASGNCGPGHFGLEQFQHLNPQQQFELSKIMNAMNSAAAATLASSSVGSAAAPIPLTTNTGLAPPTPSLITSHASGRHHADLPSSSGAITAAIADNVVSAISAGPISNTSATAIHGRIMGIGVKMPDSDKMRRLQHMVESGISDHVKQQIVHILDRISTLKPVEKLLLYLRMPGEAPETDPLRHPQNPLGTRSEINHTINWVRSHLEHDPQVSIPKQDVYNDYIAYCERLDIKPLSTADFGKVMKQVFPGIRPRRLGTRGHSRYCYAAMRKTTNLTAPQLPELHTNASGCSGANDSNSGFTSSSLAPLGADPDSWETIKTWAESLLNVKIDSAKELAMRIKSNNSLGGGSLPGNTRTNAGNKKCGQREPKEKRLLADMGPLKKRRKKKRKGSSSSESSCNMAQKPAALQIPTLIKNANMEEMSPTTSGYAASIAGPASEDEQKAINIVTVKQEFIESPNFQHVQHLPPPQTQAASIAENYLQQQMLPMNLATEQRTVLAKAPPTSASAFGAVNSLRAPLSAVKNLTPKIMEISTSAATVSNTVTASTGMGVEQMPIKEEVVDEYNPENIFCKKVRKAQQTKGFWINSPTPNIIPIVTTTASSPPPANSVIATSGTANVMAAIAPDSAVGVGSIIANYVMGPPAQIANNASTSPSTSSLDGGATPKVASRNMLLLRAKKHQIAVEATPDISVDKDADLPENLGLPRERVISICNMDKHELDDYFLPEEEEEEEEEENSQDQDTELLQYFQTGDAEEKLNSLDAAKSRNPTVIQTPTNERKLRADDGAMYQHGMRREMSAYAHKVSSAEEKVISTIVAPAAIEAGVQNAAVGSGFTTTTTVQNALTANLTSAVGSASASLALMSQKHQQQQHHQQQQQHQQQPQPHQPQNISAGNKRKINLNATSNEHTSIAPVRKNCIFLPISPNINSASTTASNTSNGGFFASPGLTHMRPKPTFNKQQSLDSDSSDPMIGASRRRRSYIMPINTSASAPPSPSALHQQQQLFTAQQMFTAQWQLTGGSDYNDVAANSAALLNEQNSLDLDMFDAATNVHTNYAQNASALGAAEDCILAPLNETQRSQSVPLSQLQRIHSPAFNRTFQMANYSACPSVQQTPVPPEFVDTTFFSENSSSQHSGCNNQATIKLEEAVVLASDSTAILDEVDVSEILSSPDFVAKFSTISQGNASTTTCSSAGSSSGYSSGACTTFGGSSAMAAGIVSRSVPSTPVPNQQINLFLGNANFYGRRRANDEINLSPTMTVGSTASVAFAATNKYGNAHALRSAYDMSKSMPTTPITTPCFRYSPTEFNRDFLINGNTIDSITSFGAVGSEGLGVAVSHLNADTLIDDAAGVTSEDYGRSAANDAESIMVGADILSNL